MITRPVRERSITGIGEMVEHGAGKHRLRGGRAALAVQRRPLRDRRRSTKGLADRYEGTQTSLSLPSHPGRRVQHRPGQRAVPQRPPLRADLRPRGRQRADPQGDQQDGHRGGPDPHGHHRVLRRLAAGEALLHVRPADRDRRGRAADRRPGARRSSRPAARRPGRRDIRCTVSIGGFVPKPHTPFQWAAQLDHETTDRRLRQAARRDPRRTSSTARRSASATTTASRASSRACSPAATAGSARSSEAVCEDGGRFDGWSEHFSFERWMTAAEHGAGRRAGRRRLVHHPRARATTEVLPVGPPRLRAGPGLAVGGLAGRRSPATEVEDCRWTPCFDCGVCPQMGTEIQTARPARRCCR